jgi:hypothetical protein
MPLTLIPGFALLVASVACSSDAVMDPDRQLVLSTPAPVFLAMDWDGVAPVEAFGVRLFGTKGGGMGDLPLVGDFWADSGLRRLLGHSAPPGSDEDDMVLAALGDQARDPRTGREVPVTWAWLPARDPAELAGALVGEPCHPGELVVVAQRNLVVALRGAEDHLLAVLVSPDWSGRSGGRGGSGGWELLYRGDPGAVPSDREILPSHLFSESEELPYPYETELQHLAVLVQRTAGTPVEGPELDLLLADDTSFGMWIRHQELPEWWVGFSTRAYGSHRARSYGGYSGWLNGARLVNESWALIDPSSSEVGSSVARWVGDDSSTVQFVSFLTQQGLEIRRALDHRPAPVAGWSGQGELALELAFGGDLAGAWAASEALPGLDFPVVDGRLLPVYINVAHKTGQGFWPTHLRAPWSMTRSVMEQLTEIRLAGDAEGAPVVGARLVVVDAGEEAPWLGVALRTAGGPVNDRVRAAAEAMVAEHADWFEGYEVAVLDAEHVALTRGAAAAELFDPDQPAAVQPGWSLRIPNEQLKTLFPRSRRPVVVSPWIIAEGWSEDAVSVLELHLDDAERGSVPRLPRKIEPAPSADAEAWACVRDLLPETGSFALSEAGPIEQRALRAGMLERAPTGIEACAQAYPHMAWATEYLRARVVVHQAMEHFDQRQVLRAREGMVEACRLGENLGCRYAEWMDEHQLPAQELASIPFSTRLLVDQPVPERFLLVDGQLRLRGEPCGSAASCFASLDGDPVVEIPGDTAAIEVVELLRGLGPRAVVQAVVLDEERRPRLLELSGREEGDILVFLTADELRLSFRGARAGFSFDLREPDALHRAQQALASSLGGTKVTAAVIAEPAIPWEHVARVMAALRSQREAGPSLAESPPSGRWAGGRPDMVESWTLHPVE